MRVIIHKYHHRQLTLGTNKKIKIIKLYDMCSRLKSCTNPNYATIKAITSVFTLLLYTTKVHTLYVSVTLWGSERCSSRHYDTTKWALCFINHALCSIVKAVGLNLSATPLRLWQTTRSCLNVESRRALGELLRDWLRMTNQQLVTTFIFKNVTRKPF